MKNDYSRMKEGQQGLPGSLALRCGVFQQALTVARAELRVRVLRVSPGAIKTSERMKHVNVDQLCCWARKSDKAENKLDFRA